MFIIIFITRVILYGGRSWRAWESKKTMRAANNTVVVAADPLSDYRVFMTTGPAQRAALVADGESACASRVLWKSSPPLPHDGAASCAATHCNSIVRDASERKFSFFRFFFFSTRVQFRKRSTHKYRVRRFPRTHSRVERPRSPSAHCTAETRPKFLSKRFSPLNSTAREKSCSAVAPCTKRTDMFWSGIASILLFV